MIFNFLFPGPNAIQFKSSVTKLLYVSIPPIFNLRHIVTLVLMGLFSEEKNHH